MKRLLVPMVHMNGTSEKDLVEQFENAFDAVQTAYEALKKSAPNGRDYYCYPPETGGFELARKQHTERLQKLHDVQNELESLIGGVMDRDTIFVEVEQ